MATNDKLTALIIKTKMEEPDLSIRKIAEKLGTTRDIVHYALKKQAPEVATKSDRVAKILENDTQAIENMSVLASMMSEDAIEEYNNGKLKKSEAEQINRIVDSSLKRTAIFDESGKGGDDKTPIIISF